MGPSFIKTRLEYNSFMQQNIPPELERYLALCKRIYEDMERDGTWPWKSDSTLSEDLVESDDNPKKI